jgi:aminopeptidase
MSFVDPRITKQAEILVDYSLKFKKGENIIIISNFAAKPLVLELYKLLIKRGANEIRLQFSDYEFAETFLKNASMDQIKAFPKAEMREIKLMDCYIRIGAPINTRGLSGTDSKKQNERSRVLKPILDYRVEKTRWVVTKYPTDAQAQEADMSFDEYTDFIYRAINGVDWNKKFKEQEKLSKIVSHTKEVRIVGPETDLRLGKAGRSAENGGGDRNMPDGEVFTSVLENQANGYITYTYPALYQGKDFNKVRLEFKSGKVIRANAEKGEEDLNKILDMDKGSRTIGELGIGNNFQIQKFTKDILFDEKIGGSIHIALGRGYKETGSKNDSGLHWDMIKDLRDGGELYFDGILVQKNGKWVVKL